MLSIDQFLECRDADSAAMELDQPLGFQFVERHRYLEPLDIQLLCQAIHLDMEVFSPAGRRQ